MKKMNKALGFLIFFALFFGGTVLAKDVGVEKDPIKAESVKIENTDADNVKEDLCAAYRSQAGYIRCKDRLTKIERMKQAKKSRQEGRKKFKRDVKSKAKNAGQVKENATNAGEVVENSGADTGMSEEDMRKTVIDLREQLKAMEDKKNDINTSPKIRALGRF
jgi:hypothetical protein